MDTTTHGPVDNLISVTESLIELMATEIELLKAMRPEEVRALQEDKNRFAKVYEDCMATLKARPELLANSGDGIKRHLRDVTARFQDVLFENERALSAVKSVSERLLHVIVGAVSEKEHGAAYSANGAMGAGSFRTGNVPLSVNERL